MTQKIGFGTSGLMGSAMTDRGRVRLLDECFDLGVTHFDTAPLYGKGEAERVIGKFAKNKKSSITIATKFGLPPNRIPRFARPLLPIARIVNRGLLRLRNSALNIKSGQNPELIETNYSSIQNEQTNIPEVSNFNLDTIDIELERSLNLLSRERVDYYLFHECKAYDISDQLIEKLNLLVKQGKIAKYGVATGAVESAKILAKNSEFKGVIQIPFDKNFHDQIRVENEVFVHSVVKQSNNHQNSGIVLEPKLLEFVRDQYSKQPLSDFDTSLLKQLILVTARSNISTLLFSSGNPSHIERFVALFNSILEFHRTSNPELSHSIL